MTNETQQTNATDPKLPLPFGGRLKTAREALGLDRKDAAAQLRLNEKIIIMMEKERYPSDLPVTFIRGYIRAYGKLLQIPEYEIKKAIEPIKPKPTNHEPLAALKQPQANVSYFMQFFTYLVMFTLLGLVGMWWYTHPALSNGNLTAENQTSAAPSAVPEQMMPPTPTTAQTAPPTLAPPTPSMATNTPAEPIPGTLAAPTPTLPTTNAAPDATATTPTAQPAAPSKPAYLQKSEVTSDTQADDAEADDTADNANNKTAGNDNNESSTDNADATD